MKRNSCILFVLTVVVWLVVICNFCSCTSTRGPAKQQRNTTIPRIQATPQAPISVNQIDLNKDGKIDDSEYQILTEDRPSVLTTFLCIGGATILVCLGTAWLSRNIPPANKSEKVEIEDDQGLPVVVEPTEDQIIEEAGVLDDDELWCHAEQDFLGDQGKRR